MSMDAPAILRLTGERQHLMRKVCTRNRDGAAVLGHGHAVVEHLFGHVTCCRSVLDAFVPHAIDGAVHLLRPYTREQSAPKRGRKVLYGGSRSDIPSRLCNSFWMEETVLVWTAIKTCTWKGEKTQKQKMKRAVAMMCIPERQPSFAAFCSRSCSISR
jgi:hypothetical protein